jgi:hypothetical protein
MIKRTVLALLAFSLLAFPAAAQAGEFGFLPGSVGMRAENKDGTTDELAGSHPYAFSVSFSLKTDSEGKSEGGVLRDAITDLPPGLFGNVLALPRCSHQSFEGVFPQCPVGTQVGILHASVPSFGGQVFLPLYNLVPPPGAAAELAGSVSGYTVILLFSARTEEGYRVRASALNVPQETTAVQATVWGVPADPSHDSERGPEGGLESSEPLVPFLVMPTSCQSPLETRIAIDSKQAPGDFLAATAFSLDPAENPAPLTGCESVPFAPQIAAQPTSRAATAPSGLDFELKLPNQGLASPGAIAETEPRKTVVTLPEGVIVNPSFAEGVSVCTEAQYKAEQLETGAGEGCPQASKLGSVVAKTPLLEEPAEGAVYLAEPYENPFDSLTALYMVVRAPERGVLIKQAGKVSFDSQTGQITTTFDDLPPLPYSSFKLHFREGARAPLVTPRTCGQYTTVAEMTPFSAESDEEAVTREASFQIERGPEGGPCPSGGLPPFHPHLLAGSENNAAGRFSPFLLNLSRTDAEQEITHFSIKLPPGITGKLAGVPYCPDAAIEAAKARTGPHGGEEELASPSCPQASQVGTTLTGAGVGGVLVYVPGKVYLAGPYHGSKLSIAAIVAAKAGPFDLGTVVVREALEINPETAEVFIDATGSDPIPHIIRGVPVHLRDIRAYVDRPEFALNPTDCTPTSTASTVLGAGLDFVSEADDNPITVTSPFQAADCANLPFKPQLGLRLKGGTNRGAHPAFSAHLKMGGIGEAGIASAQVTLPRSEFIENAHFKTICTRVQFKAGAGNGAQCPPNSIYGSARAITPLLSEPLEGPVFLRSSEHQLPDLVVALHNSQVDFDLVGRIDSVKGGGLRNTFESAPDAPVSSFDLYMAGGKKGLFVNSTDLCAKTYRAKALFSGQNGRRFEAKPKMAAKCNGSKRKRSHKRHKRRR